MPGEPGIAHAAANAPTSPGAVSSEGQASPLAVEVDQVERPDWRPLAFWFDEPSFPDPSQGTTFLSPRVAAVQRQLAEQGPDLHHRVVTVIDAAARAGLAVDDSAQLAMALYLRSALVELRNSWERSAIPNFLTNVAAWPVGFAAAVATGYGLLAHWPVPVWTAPLAIVMSFIVLALYDALPWVDWVSPALMSAVGLACAAVTLSISYPGALAAAALAAPAVAVALVAGSFAIFIGGRTIMRRSAYAVDPYLLLPLSLAEPFAELQTLSEPGGQATATAPLPVDSRRKLSLALEKAASDVRAYGTLAGRLGPGLGPDVQSALAARRESVLAWLRDTESQVLWPLPGAAEAIGQRLLTAVAGICMGDWSSVDGEPSAARRTSRLKALLPRLGVSAALLAVAWGVPALLGSALSDAAATTLRVSLTITALTALLTPTEALDEAARTVASAGRK